jgi:hypothetical protein
VTVRVAASDNIGVKKVEFYINSILVSTDTSSPYQYTWHVPNTRNVVYTIVAKAYDAAGNVGSDTILVTSR